jgi:signal peptidase II
VPALVVTGIVVIGAAVDLATKAWALSRLSGGRHVTLAGSLLRLQLVINHGAGFGFAAGHEPTLTVLSFVIVVALWWWAIRASSRAVRLGAALAAAGGLGNLIDRLTRPPSILHGGVVDWVHLSFYDPTFNLADVMLRFGVLLAAVAWLLRHRAAAARQPAAEPSQSGLGPPVGPAG